MNIDTFKNRLQKLIDEYIQEKIDEYDILSGCDEFIDIFDNQASSDASFKVYYEKSFNIVESIFKEEYPAEYSKLLLLETFDVKNLDFAGEDDIPYSKWDTIKHFYNLCREGKFEDYF